MSMLSTGAFSAIAFQLVAALDAYEQDLERLVACRDDLELYQRVSQQMDQMRMYSGALPKLSAQWVEVLIGHFELTHCMWRLQGGEPCLEELRALHGRHGQVVETLRQRARQSLVAQ